jgi:DNA-binding response OmpR family regulator
MIKILVVDDDDVIRLLYEEELNWHGYDVMSCSELEGLIQTISERCPDVLVLEAEIGGLRGLDILPDIRNRYYDLPVVLSTVSPTLKYDPRCIAADYCVLKSPDLSELRLRIEMALDSNAGTSLWSGKNELRLT